MQNNAVLGLFFLFFFTVFLPLKIPAILQNQNAFSTFDTQETSERQFQLHSLGMFGALTSQFNL